MITAAWSWLASDAHAAISLLVLAGVIGAACMSREFSGGAR